MKKASLFDACSSSSFVSSYTPAGYKYQILSVGGTVAAVRTMEKYENLGLVGEGSYGMVLKCKHKESGQMVAIKKFLESEDDKMVKKIAMREVRMLKQLRHDHLVNLLEVFRRKKRLYLVFEFVDHTVLDELEKCPNGLDETTCRKILWQVLKGIEFCHLNNIIHRDIKPENILVSKNGIVKLCDFGFARTLAQPGEIYTDYVATRWYRAPELLVGDTKYGKAVDIWAVGCLLVEMLTGEPLFPGDSDIDQLYHIVKVFGNLTKRHKEVFLRNPLFVGMRLPEVREVTPLEKKFTRISTHSLGLMKDCLHLDPDERPTCTLLLKHEFFTRDGFSSRYAHDLKAKISKEQEKNGLMNAFHEKEDGDKDGDTTNNKTTTKKKKKIPLGKKDSKIDDHNKGQNKPDNNKANKKDETKESEDKSKRKVGDPPDKGGNKKTPPSTSEHVSLPPADSKSKTQTKTTSGDNDKDKGAAADKSIKTQDKSDRPEKTDKSEKILKIQKNEQYEKSDKSETRSKSDKSVEDETDGRRETGSKSDKHETREKDIESRSENKSDSVMERAKGAESKSEHNKEKGDSSHNTHSKEKRDRTEKMDKLENDRDDYREKDKENSVSYKDSTSIPPIHPSGHNLHQSPNNQTPTIPSISSPNTVAISSPHIFVPPVNNQATSSPRGGNNFTGPAPLRVNDKMVKKPNAFKKSTPNHHSVVLSPQPLQSEKSHLHDKSLEKLRTQKRETTMFDMKRDKEMISFPEVRGAEAAPVKSKSKLQPTAARSNIATIPHITNLDPFSSNSQVEAHSSEKTSESNLPSV